MKDKLIKIMSICLVLSFLTGCWDQKMLKDTMFLSTVAYEKKKGNKVLSTIAIRSYTSKEGTLVNKTYHVAGDSPRDDRTKINQQVSGIVMSAKKRIILFEDRLAKEGILELSDVLYRTPESPLTAKYVIVEGKPSTIVELQQVGEELIGEYLDGVVHTAEVNSLVPIETLQSLCTVLFDEGKGLALPYMKLNTENKTVDVIGTALFNEDKFSDITLNSDESKALLLLGNQKDKYMIMSHKITIHDQQYVVSYDVSDAKAKMHVKPDAVHGAKVIIPLNIKVSINEFTKNEMSSPALTKNVQKEIEKILQKKAEKVVEKLQKANCDFLEIGREVAAYHPSIWKRLKWRQDYKNISINPKVQVEIIHRGVIN
ncbi:Ger(x)C family spore germination protein [Priestia aryabhattai]|uniref:Ger(x)C family spore germination protein n=1 Tax=Priestia aryabhattai TaxID=412384 RepID=UPI001593DE43